MRCSNPGVLVRVVCAYPLRLGRGSIISKTQADADCVWQIWDIRCMKRVGEIADAHLMPVRDIDFAHQQQHRIVSAGDDCKICIWDLRFALLYCFPC